MPSPEHVETDGNISTSSAVPRLIAIVSYGSSTSGTESVYIAIVKLVVTVAPRRLEAVKSTVIPELDW